MHTGQHIWLVKTSCWISFDSRYCSYPLPGGWRNQSLPIYYKTLSSGEGLLMRKCKQNISKPLSIWGWCWQRFSPIFVNISPILIEVAIIDVLNLQISYPSAKSPTLFVATQFRKGERQLIPIYLQYYLGPPWNKHTGGPCFSPQKPYWWPQGGPYF